jgi:hypothetical protein
MTRQEATKRRQQIANAMQEVQNISDVAIEFGVSEDLVRRACREFNIKSSSRDAKESKAKKVNDQSVVSDLRTGKSPTDVANHFDMPVAKVARAQKRVTSGLPVGKSR